MDLTDFIGYIERAYPTQVESCVGMLARNLQGSRISIDDKKVAELISNLQARRSTALSTPPSAARAAYVPSTPARAASAARAACVPSTPARAASAARAACVPSTLPSINIPYEVEASMETVQKFREEFVTFIGKMQLPAEVPLEKVTIPRFSASYSRVRGDGNCGPRAFLTLLALHSIGRLLPENPQDLCMWIFRLKELMIPFIIQMSKDCSFLSALLSIPQNGTVENLDQYFALLMSDGYYFTNFEFKVLAIMFDTQINIIRQESNQFEEYQCFTPKGVPIKPIKRDHLNILYQTGHYVPIVEILFVQLRYVPFNEQSYM